MGFYNVVQPCVVGKLHYARPTSQPIDVDDETAAPLVESGCLEPYLPGHWSETIDPGTFTKLIADRLPERDTPGIRAGDYADAHESVREALDSGEIAGVSFSVEPETDPSEEPKPRRSRRRGDSSGSAD